MPQQQFTKPFYIFFLVLPYGISSGFVSITLPYLLHVQGFSVAQTSAIVTFGVSANVIRFIWGPVADLTLSLRKWYWIGIAACTASLFFLCSFPFSLKAFALLSAVVFISQLASTFVVLPVGGIMAHRIEEQHKGAAGGWFQAGNLGGAGLGGGLGLWLASHYNITTAGAVLCIICIVSALVVLGIKDVQHNVEKSFRPEIISMGKDLLGMLRVPIVLFVIILVILPIGAGAAANLWSAIANDWKADADTVALVTGLLSGIVSAVGCVAGGFIADRWGNWIGYLGSGVVIALVALVMAAMPYQPSIYIGGVLAYAFAQGMAYATFSSTVLYAIGKKNASTKYSLLSSISNIPVAYMTAFDGWAHDKYNSKYMLIAEAIAGIVFVLICIVVLKQMKSKNLILETID